MFWNILHFTLNIMFFYGGLGLQLISSIGIDVFGLIFSSIKGNMLFILVRRSHGSHNLGVKIEPILAAFWKSRRFFVFFFKIVQKFLLLLHFDVFLSNNLPKVLAPEFFCEILIIKDFLLKLTALTGTFPSVFIGRYLGLCASWSTMDLYSQMNSAVLSPGPKGA